MKVQGFRSPDFGAEIRPHSQCQKVCFFPIPGKKSQFDQNIFFFLWGVGGGGGGGGGVSIFISYNKNSDD